MSVCRLLYLIFFVLAPDPIPRLRTWLSSNFVGQEYALEVVESLININLYEIRTTPLVLGFSGPVSSGRDEGGRYRQTAQHTYIYTVRFRISE